MNLLQNKSLIEMLISALLSKGDLRGFFIFFIMELISSQSQTNMLDFVKTWCDAWATMFLGFILLAKGKDGKDNLEREE